jgi:predicted Zn-ribbon and HTH transcriptional regulator
MTEEPDVMDQPWACLSCSAKFRFGQIRMLPGGGSLSCPECRSANIHPADGTVHELDEYHGEIGTRN